MRNHKAKIIEQLRQGLEHSTADNSYSQRLLGVAISTQSTGEAAAHLDAVTYKVRVVVKTSTSPYFDGMDIFFHVAEGELLIDPDYYENSPDFHGGTVEDNLSWLRELGEIAYLKLENPFRKGVDTDCKK